jgi:hypothetical protein
MSPATKALSLATNAKGPVIQIDIYMNKPMSIGAKFLIKYNFYLTKYSL